MSAPSVVLLPPSEPQDVILRRQARQYRKEANAMRLEAADAPQKRTLALCAAAKHLEEAARWNELEALRVSQ